ncbi:baseplate J/gp47 family protein [Pelomonas sp. P7]|uniref:Baseplate J/gp47 family protein n=1 Tax=Pelomonas caseinilytica TaxID=2906763 RepID=A0ABS8X7V8_9BURK|nr:baseplate J/gp47 family protein [Pelomonas sp. P7]MCE4536732.1 baseplate J/gp47 family protein [Pelomonas sp. P7]
MPIQLPAIDDRDHAALVRDTLALAAVHAPEWTHTGPSDPGVTLVELFAFMAESLLYRANLIPERNRLKFLQLLGVGLRPAQPARALVQFANESGERKTLTLPSGLPLLAGAVPFLSDTGLDLPPVTGLVVFKRVAGTPDPAVLDYYRQLYEATGRDFAGNAVAGVEPVLYDSVQLADLAGPIDLGAETVDGALWIALLAPPKPSAADLTQARAELAGRTLSIGLVPQPPETRARIQPGRPATPPPSLSAWIPKANAVGSGTPGEYRRLDAVAPTGFPQQAGILQVTLPAHADDIGTWAEAEPLEAGVGELPPQLTDAALADRLLTWLRIDGLAPAGVQLAWAGTHCAAVRQRSRVIRELLPPGDGSPEQRRRLSHGQVLADSVQLLVGGQLWALTDELEAAPAEGQPGAQVFALDAEGGELRFGDGMRGARPAAGAEMAVRFDWSSGAAGNVAAGAIKLGPTLPPGVKLSNPRPADGGIDAESAADGEKRIPLVLRHRERAVSAEDFDAILRETPQADVGRIEVLPAWHPELSPGLPGDQPGVVTCMVIPRQDPRRPDYPLPDADFIDALCAWLAPRRLVTCEVLLRGPAYAGLWISVGIELHAGQGVAEVRERVKAALKAFLAPLPGPASASGWPLFKAVAALELATVAARVEGVLGVTGLLLGDSTGARRDSVPLAGLQLPLIAGLSVSLGDPVPLSDLIGQGTGSADGAPAAALRLPVPRVPENC